MKWASVMPYDCIDEFSGEDKGTRFHMDKFNSKKEMLEHLQTEIYCEETRKPLNYKSLKSYQKLGFIFLKNGKVWSV